MTPESLVQHEVSNYLEGLGLLFWKNKTTGIYDAKHRCFRLDRSRHARNGISDLLGVLPDGRFLAIELKSAKGKLSPDQKSFIDEVLANNGVAFVARGFEDVKINFEKFGVTLG